MNCVNKFLLTWDTRFWDTEQYIVYTPETRDKFNYFVNVNKFHPSVNALMTFAYADYGRQTETMTDAAVIAEIMAHLRDVYGNAIPNPTNMLRTKWSTNENAYGAYSYTAVETQMQHFNDLAEAINDKVFFAGEHTNINYFSTAHGAYSSGLREADKIIALATVLPIELLHFTANYQKNKAHLHWATATERDTVSFTVEQSRDGQTFKPISEVKTRGSNSSYEIVDESPFGGVNYYRLSINDLDHKNTYSKIVSVVLDNSFSPIKVFPSIVNDKLTITTDEGEIVNFQMVNMAGQVVADKMDTAQSSSSVLTIAVNHLPTGIYLIKAKNTGGKVLTTKVIKN